MDSSEIRTQLARLHIERIDATEIGLADNDAYMADLEEEMLKCHTLLAIAPVGQGPGIRGFVDKIASSA
jgi:hypothetical protein